MTEKNRIIFFALIFALVFYIMGAMFVEQLINYPSWRLIGAGEFKAYHNMLSARIIPFMVIPWFVEILLTFVLMKYRPRAIPLAAVILVQVLNLIGLVSSIFIQIPIQLQLDESGFSLEAINRLIATDPIRWVSAIVKSLLYIWMMVSVASGSNKAARGRETLVTS
jgi:hypothetical protein